MPEYIIISSRTCRQYILTSRSSLTVNARLWLRHVNHYHDVFGILSKPVNGEDALICTHRLPVDSQHKGPVMGSSDVFFVARLNDILTNSRVLGEIWRADPLWPNDVIKRHRSRWTQVQIMACCLYVHPAIDWTNVDQSSVKFWCIHMKAIHREYPIYLFSIWVRK